MIYFPTSFAISEQIKVPVGLFNLQSGFQFSGVIEAMEVLQEKYEKFLLMVLLQNHYVLQCVSEDQIRIVDSSAVSNDLAGAEAKFQFTQRLYWEKQRRGRLLLTLKRKMT